MNTPGLIHDSLAEIPEDKLVNRIVTDILWRREFFMFHGMPSGMVTLPSASLSICTVNSCEVRTLSAVASQVQ